MRLNYITFMVRDIDSSVDFYQDLAGLKMINRINVDAGEIVFLANKEGETMIELIEFEGVEKVTAKGMVMSFAVEGDLDALREKAIKSGYDTSEIIAREPKPRHFTVTDPDGIVVEFSM